MRKPNLGILIKPAGPDCNMACRYCYYRPVRALYPDVPRPRMSLDVFEAVCRQYLGLEPAELKVGWQGGEPTLMGLDFFRGVVEIERRHTPPGRCFGNSLQTNGLLLDDEWCSFLRENNFLVGLSIDGPAPANEMRRMPDGSPAFETAMRALDLLKRHSVETNILVVISRANADRAREIFEFLVANDCHYSQFIPCTEPAGRPGELTAHSVAPDQYADFMIGLFDAWTEKDDPSFYVRRIDNWLHLFFGLPPECCEYRGDCSNLLTVEWNGDVYPCDFFVEERYRLGNVAERTLTQMLGGRAFRDFMRAAGARPAACANCEWWHACKGGCTRHRQKLGIAGSEPSYLCEANRRIFDHVFSTLRRIKAEPLRPRLHEFLNKIERDMAQAPPGGRAAQGAAPRRGPASGTAGRAPGRNDPCPCGSGRKFKQCCGRRASVVRER